MNLKWRYSKGKNRNRRIILITLVVVIVLATFIMFMIQRVNNTVKQSCYDNLVMASDSLAKDLRKISEEDLTVLSALANVIADEEDLSDAKLTRLLNCYDISTTYLSYVEILKPDNTMLDSDGTVRDVSGSLEFAAEAEKGKIVSNVEISTKNTNNKVIRNTIPVIKNGETIYILYGTIVLQDFSEKFDVDIYDGQAYIFIEDGNTGEFLLDTWHDTLGNISDFTNRELSPEYSWEQVISDMEEGKSNRLSLMSTILKEVVYLYYAPSGINNLNVMVMIPQKIALAENRTIRSQLYFMAAVIGFIMIGYMIIVTSLLLKSYNTVKKIGFEDQNTGLKNRNAYDRYMAENKDRIYPLISCIYIDVNGLHEINNQYGHAAGDQMLQTVADSLKTNFPYALIYRIGGDEFVIFCEKYKNAVILERMQNAIKQIEEHEYTISYGIVSYENEKGLERITKQADEEMLEYKKQYYKTHNRRERP